MSSHAETMPTPTAGTRPLARRARLVLLAVTVLLPALLVLQVYLAGLFLMGGVGARDWHQVLGQVLVGPYPLLVLVVGLLARAPRRFWLVFAAFAVVVVVQMLLPSLTASGGTGWFRALHVVNAGVLMGLSYQLLEVVRRLER